LLNAIFTISFRYILHFKKGGGVNYIYKMKLRKSSAVTELLSTYWKPKFGLTCKP